MADKKTAQKKEEKTEREYVIPLRREWRKVPRYKRANKAVKAVKEFLVRHMKIRDRDLKKVKVDRFVNEFIWSRSIKHPPNKIKIKAVKEGDIVKAELSEAPEKLKFKKLREERIDKKAGEVAEKKKKKTEETKEETEKEEESETKKEDEKEKKAAVVEAGKEMEKQAAKKIRHEVKEKGSRQKHQFRKALAK